jgi:FlaA1/EpsC-like NDP-sugar epimerase
VNPSLSSPDWASLLGRPGPEDRPVRIARASGACVLVTGAGGFIGAEIVRVFAASGAAKIVLLDICEQYLFEISSEMAALGHGPRCVAVLGSVCDRQLLAALFGDHRPEIVVHAAALKHVALMEQNPFAAVETNALGTWCAADAAEAQGAHSMILVSTDKAAAPRSIMGAAKRIAELVMLAPSDLHKTAVRLVNVVGSPCSVAPIFAEQIARGGPVTVTQGGARRWFLTLHETVALIAEAVEASASGVLIPEPGQPLLIAELARRMIAAGRKDVPIVFTVPRPGEKLDEALILPGESDAGPASPHLRQVLSPAVPDLGRRLPALAAAVTARNLAAMLRIVEELVPEYEPSVLLREPSACAAP